MNDSFQPNEEADTTTTLSPGCPTAFDAGLPTLAYPTRRTARNDDDAVARSHSFALRGDTACSLLEPVVEVLSASAKAGGFYGFSYRYQIPRTIALAMRGSTDDAAAALASHDEKRFPSWQYLDCERALAQAWVVAAQGAITEASSISLSTAETARVNGRFAAEVMCLQTATQFGDRSCAPRLHELERSWRVLVSAWRPGSPRPCATATPPN